VPWPGKWAPGHDRGRLLAGESLPQAEPFFTAVNDFVTPATRSGTILEVEKS